MPGKAPSRCTLHASLVETSSRRKERGNGPPVLSLSLRLSLSFSYVACCSASRRVAACSLRSVLYALDKRSSSRYISDKSAQHKVEHIEHFPQPQGGCQIITGWLQYLHERMRQRKRMYTCCLQDHLDHWSSLTYPPYRRPSGLALSFPPGERKQGCFPA